MQYTTLHGYHISKLTLGTVQMGLNYSIQNLSKPDARQSFEILEYALQSGINTLDTARSYGNAEQIIGSFRESKPGQQVNIVTKFKISDTNLHHFGQARAEVYKSITTSLAALRIHRIPICLFHKDKDQPIELVMEMLPRILESLVEDELIDTGGISVYHPDEVRSTLEYEVIKAIQVPMNVFDQRLKQSGLLQLMHAHQKLIFIRSIFLKGLFFMKPEQLAGTIMEASPYLQTLQEIANQTNMSVAQLAFSYVRDMEEITSMVFGADHVEQVQQNIQLFQGSTLEAATRQAIENEFQNLRESIITPGLWTL